jgi:single-stranded-DNA-specific exonuclease
MNSNTFVPELETETSHEYRSGSRICTRVVGVTFNGRQEVIARLAICEDILLKREPTNPYDHNAISVERQNGQLIGYINRYLAATLAPFLDAHRTTVPASIQCLTGYPELGYSLGVVITFNVP